jgi:hypothetical protein
MLLLTVFVCMFFWRDKKQVLKSIIFLVAIDMVNKLKSRQTSAQMTLHNIAVFIYMPTVYHYPSIWITHPKKPL